MDALSAAALGWKVLTRNATPRHIPVALPYIADLPVPANLLDICETYPIVSRGAYYPARRLCQRRKQLPSFVLLYFSVSPLRAFEYRFLYYKELRPYWANSDAILKPLRLCVGGEWHRFPSSFYIPHEKVRFSFLRSEFHGQLPQPFPVSRVREFVPLVVPHPPPVLSPDGVLLPRALLVPLSFFRCPPLTIRHWNSTPPALQFRSTCAVFADSCSRVVRRYKREN